MRGSFPAPHHHDPNKTLPIFQIWVMVVFLSSNTAGERLRYQRIQTLRRPCNRLLRHRSMKHKAVDRAGEKFLMAHFPASLSLNRLAGSSSTQKVCEASKSRNRTGSVISKSRRSGLSQMPATMTQRGLRHQSLLELIASFPPSHPGNRARRQQGPRGPQRSEGRPSLADWLNLCTVSSTEQETARAPTRELEGTSHRSVCISSGTSGRCSCRNFGTGIITLVLPSGSVHRD